MATVFEKLNSINVNEHTEKKDDLTYLSWAWAWEKMQKACPDTTYKVRTFDGKPFLYDQNLGYLVMTEMTAGGVTHEMWLPVMDGANRAMKAEPYTIKTKYKEITVQGATMFDINKAIMRCLTKNIAMFGLGLYIYAGEDLPETEVEEQKTAQDVARKKLEKIDGVQLEALREILACNGIDEKFVLSLYKLNALEDVTNQKYENIQSHLEDIKRKQEEKK